MKNSSDTIGNRTRDLPVSSAVFTLTDQYNFGMYHAWLDDRDCVVGIITRYGLEGPGIESRFGAKFSALVQTDPGFHPAYYTKDKWSLSRGQRSRDVAFITTPSSAEVKERVTLYIL
jgi:hypothetical protein